LPRSLCSAEPGMPSREGGRSLGGSAAPGLGLFGAGPDLSTARRALADVDVSPFAPVALDRRGVVGVDGSGVVDLPFGAWLRVVVKFRAE
jgi:hypothetical protein